MKKWFHDFCRGVLAKEMRELVDTIQALAKQNTDLVGRVQALRLLVSVLEQREFALREKLAVVAKAEFARGFDLKAAFEKALDDNAEKMMQSGGA